MEVGLEVRRQCHIPNCSNRGFLAVDTNFILFMIEGVIEYVLDNFEELHTRAEQVEQIVTELDTTFRIIETCCALDENLHTSSAILREEILVIDPETRQMVGLKRYTHQQRDEIFRVVRQHLTNEFFVDEEMLGEHMAVYENPRVRPHGRDATLLIAALQLAKENEPTIILTRDPDFVQALRVLLDLQSVRINNEDIQTDKILKRGFFEFTTRIHQSCSLPTNRYKALIAGFQGMVAARIPDLDKDKVKIKELAQLRILWKAGADSIEQKAARMEAEG